MTHAGGMNRGFHQSFFKFGLGHMTWSHDLRIYLIWRSSIYLSSFTKPNRNHNGYLKYKHYLFKAILFPKQLIVPTQHIR